MIAPRSYANPYLAGFALGGVLLACFAMTGRGLGASGAFGSVSATLWAVLLPQQASASEYFRRYLIGAGTGSDWLVFEVLGMMLGAALSAAIAGRWRLHVDRGARLAPGPRVLAATSGGLLMGVGSVLARGCTSGQALSGGALLSVGSWIFMAGVFFSAYLVAPLVRRLWR